MDRELATLSAHLEIRQVLYRYCRADVAGDSWMAEDLFPRGGRREQDPSESLFG